MFEAINLNLILEFVNLLERGLVVQQNVPKSAVLQLNRNRTLAPLDHVPSNLKIMAESVPFSLTQVGSWLEQDKSNAKVVEDGQKFHQQLSWLNAVNLEILHMVLLHVVLDQHMDLSVLINAT